jgi:L,D-peptidoglycan transpeptidase YkuD (ErfK/YbiS/YcfS/YnhG family)
MSSAAGEQAPAEGVRNEIHVWPDGRLEFEGVTYRCALGRAGVTTDKREGDGATPAGRFPLRKAWYRPDRMPPPMTFLALGPTLKSDGWCDDPEHPDYNRAVKLPFAASHERMWREDELYDLVVFIGFNDDPPVPGRGSAIFMHVAKPDYAPTDGCVALDAMDLTRVLARCSRATELVIHETDD